MPTRGFLNRNQNRLYLTALKLPHTYLLRIFGCLRTEGRFFSTDLPDRTTRTITNPFCASNNILFPAFFLSLPRRVRKQTLIGPTA